MPLPVQRPVCAPWEHWVSRTRPAPGAAVSSIAWYFFTLDRERVDRISRARWTGGGSEWDATQASRVLRSRVSAGYPFALAQASSAPTWAAAVTAPLVT